MRFLGKATNCKEIGTYCKKVIDRNKSVLTANSVNVEISKNRDFAKVLFLFENEHQEKFPFNIGLSISRT